VYKCTVLYSRSTTSAQSLERHATKFSADPKNIFVGVFFL
jgi:hypothetical protein